MLILCNVIVHGKSLFNLFFRKQSAPTFHKIHPTKQQEINNNNNNNNNHPSQTQMKLNENMTNVLYDVNEMVHGSLKGPARS